jgi:hypothetical protein
MRRASAFTARDNALVIVSLNLGLRFVLELAAVIALGWWGFHAAGGAAAWLLGIGSPVLLILVWALFIAPRAVYPRPAAVRLIVGTVLLEIAVGSLAMVGQAIVAIVLAVVVALNAAALAVTGAADGARR